MPVICNSHGSIVVKSHGSSSGDGKDSTSIMNITDITMDHMDTLIEKKRAKVQESFVSLTESGEEAHDAIFTSQKMRMLYKRSTDSPKLNKCW
mmetsp:Transcript_39694/g.60834  ORF Transcript_39694/g.60834 Transcript_39694/m.60834 type:complete len:93 (+) Transcript_39694:1121-1399(+)